MSLTWLNVDVGAAQQVTASGGTTSLKSSTKRKKRLMKSNKLLSNLTADMGGASVKKRYRSLLAAQLFTYL